MSPPAIAFIILLFATFIGNLIGICILLGRRRYGVNATD
jgi:hypothetical protein